MPKQEQACRFSMTFNLPVGKTFADYRNFIQDLASRMGASYACGQGEEAPTTGQKHFQFYMEFAKKKDFNAVRKRAASFAGAAVHVIVSKGSGSANRAYCSKDDSRSKEPGAEFVEMGAMKAQGERTDIGGLFQLIKEGATMLEIAELAPSTFAQYGRSLMEYRSMVSVPRDWPTKLIILWGPSGHGKTAQAYTLNPERVRFCDRRFFVGYTGTNPVVLFDEFDPASMSREVWSEMCDRYKTSFEVKGGSINWAPKVIVFTSNNDPATWYCDKNGVQHEAVRRRFEEFAEIRFFGEKIPHTQRTLDAFWTRPSVPVGQSAAGSAGTAMPSSGRSVSNDAVMGDTEIIDLTEETEEEDTDWGSSSGDSDYERRRKRMKRQTYGPTGPKGKEPAK